MKTSRSSVWGRALTLGVLAGLALGVSALPARAGEAEPTFRVPTEDLFPSLIIATSTMKPDPDEAWEVPAAWGKPLGDRNGMLALTVRVEKVPMTLRLSVKCDSIMEPTEMRQRITEAGTYTLHPKIKWKYRELSGLRESEPVNLSWTLKADDAEIASDSERLTVRAVNDCLLAWVDDNKKIQTFEWLFAAYVNEDAPVVDKILREALDAGIVNNFSGYQSGDPDVVSAQVYAIWHAMQMRGLRYSSVTAIAPKHGRTFSQHVRLIDESFENAQANCVDGTVLLASVLRKIGLETDLVLVPGHMFLAVHLDKEGKEGLYIETTMMGALDIRELPDQRGLLDFGDVVTKHDASWHTFASALARGEDKFHKYEDKFDDEDDTTCFIIRVSDSRKMGVRPIMSPKARR